jgi:O-acetyl-ADP-ribose deacetylase (regulator of RNase III)
MIEYKHGDIFDEDVEAIVNTVNCVGVMGRGLALQFKNRFPENFRSYEQACKRKEVLPGKMFVYETEMLTNPKYIINFPSKRHWRGASRIEDIESGLADLKEIIQGKHISSIAIPPLGCGLGGLNWNMVRGKIEKELIGLPDVKIIAYEPGNAPQAGKIARNRAVPSMTPGRAALIELIDNYQKGLLSPFITLLEVHKLMYFLQEAGENLRLQYNAAIYGPYAENLRHVLNAVEGHFLSGYADGGDSPDKQLNLVPQAVNDAKIFLQDEDKTNSRIQKVEALVNGFESPFGLELLATIHWVVKENGAKSLKDVIEKTYAWNERKKQFSPRQIRLAISVLSEKNWISPIPETIQ